MAITLDQAANDPSTPATQGIIRRISRPNGINTEVVILPATWAGKFVRFCNDSPAATGPILYVRFARDAADAAIVPANNSTISAGPNPPAGTIAEGTGLPDLVIPPGSFQDERIDENWTVFGHIATAATGQMRALLKQGDDVEDGVL